MTRRNAFLASMAAVAALSLPAFGAPAFADPVIGEPAPSFETVTAAGQTISLSDFQGETVVLEWTNHSCPYVRKHYDSENMQALQAAAAQDGITWIQIISSAPGKQGHVSADEALALNERRGATPAHVVLDPSGEIGRAYDARTTPHMYIIDSDGTLRYAGAIDDKPSAQPASLDGAHNYVTAALLAMESGEQINPAQTVAYGCNVKY